MEILDPRTLRNDGKKPLFENLACERCGLTDWLSFPDKFDIRCGGCGFWLIESVMKELGED